MKTKSVLVMLCIGTLIGSMAAGAQDHSMSFFVTSEGLGKGGDLGGLEGADAHCKKLATAAGAGDREWRAYLSTEAPDKRGVFARARIGAGPWYNAHGILIAANVTDLQTSFLHSMILLRIISRGYFRLSRW